MSNITTDPAYAAFKDAGFCVPLVLLIFCKASVCLLGIILNGDLVYITWKTKTLRGACNLQIALNAFSICIQQSSSFVTLAVVISGTNFIPLGYCGIIQAIPLFCTIFTNGIAFSIGVDRLLSVAFPIWYMVHDKKNYLNIIIIFCCLYALIVPICGINISLSNPERPVMCTVIDPMQKDATWVVIMLLSVNLSSVFCYICVWIILMFKGSMKKTQLNVFKSLSVILLMEICGWISNYSIRLIIGAANLHTLNSW
uniref:G_PROTEIN_RECEP_F1_2 domain-containing protein n=1 Tax=Meloidogyne incognita TaxID=6306 RepID=A0A914M791_MELIC